METTVPAAWSYTVVLAIAWLLDVSRSSENTEAASQKTETTAAG